MIAELQKLGIDLKGRTSGQFKTTCPKCSHTRKKKSDRCLSVNIDGGIYNCHNCGWSGAIGIKKKVYFKPEDKPNPVSDKVYDWFKMRGISKQTVSDFFITESMEFMPQKGKEVKVINFKYYNDENLVNIKYRTADKQFKMVQGAELIFYNLNSIKGQNDCVICEGEMDALSFHEVGIKNVVSVPNGASKGNQKLEYLDNCWHYFEGIDKIIIATDNDEPGEALREEIARRLGKERCYIFRYPEGTKDANDILVGGGPDVLKYCIENIVEYPLEGIQTVEDIESAIDYIYENGYPKGFNVGYPEFDKHLTFRIGELTTISGVPGSGKSEFIDQLMIRLSMLHGWKWGIWSAENQPSALHFAKLAEKYIGKGSFYSKERNFQITTSELTKAKEFINEHFFFVSFIDENLTIDSLIQKSKELAKRHGINGFLIDPYNYLEHKIRNGQSETQYVSEFLTKLSMNCKLTGLHTFLVAHPTKIQKKDGAYEVPTLYQISGSAHFFNKTDNGIIVYRHFDPNNSDNLVEVHIQKVRFKFIGKIGMVEFNYNRFNGTYHE